MKSGAEGVIDEKLKNEKMQVMKEIEKLIRQNNKEKESVLKQVRITNEYKSLPWFLQQDRILDDKMRKTNDPGYDPCTVYIPQKEMERLTAYMSQYWNLKGKNFDKILLFQKGKFYELYYLDAIIGHYFLKIQWSQGLQ